MKNIVSSTNYWHAIFLTGSYKEFSSMVTKCKNQNDTFQVTTCFARYGSSMLNRDECSWTKPLSQNDCKIHLNDSLQNKLCFMGSEYSNICQLLVENQPEYEINQLMRQNVLAIGTGKCNSTLCKK